MNDKDNGNNDGNFFSYLDVLGSTAFAPVKMDIGGNIKVRRLWTVPLFTPNSVESGFFLPWMRREWGGEFEAACCFSIAGTLLHLNVTLGMSGHIYDFTNMTCQIRKLQALSTSLFPYFCLHFTAYKNYSLWLCLLSPPQKLSLKFDMDPKVFHTLQNMIYQEINSNTCTVRNSATDALLWLKRCV